MTCKRCKHADWYDQSPRNAGRCRHPDAPKTIEGKARRLPVLQPRPEWCPLELDVDHDPDPDMWPDEGVVDPDIGDR